MEIANIKRALTIIENSNDIAELMPEVRSNLVMAKGNAENVNEVAGVPGRITTVKGKAKAFTEPDWGASNHMARLVLEVMKHDSHIRSAINLRYDPILLEIMEKLGFKISFYDRREEPEENRRAEGGTMSWGVNQAINRVGEVPDVIYHTGDWGKEPIIALIGCDAVSVAERAVSIARLYNERNPKILFARNRYSYYIKGESHSDCIFCMISDEQPNVEERVLYKDDDNMVMMNIYPYNWGHLEVMPRKHYTDFNELDNIELENFFILVQKTINLIRKVIKPDGINMGFNLGEAAGSSIEHLHLHLVPRFRNEGGFMETTASTRVILESLDETFNRYKKEIELLKVN